MAEPVEVYEVTGAGVGANAITSSGQRAASLALSGAIKKSSNFARPWREQAALTVKWLRLLESLVWESRGCSSSSSTRIAQQGWLIVESGSVSYGKATPYLPLIDLLKSYFKIHDRDNQREIREKVTGKLLTLDESLKPTLPAFLALLDIPVEDQQWQALDPPQKRQRTLDACKRLLFRESQAQPLLLVFEDLHWLDSETQTLLDSLVESLPTGRLLLLVNYRPEYQHGWGSKTLLLPTAD